MVLLATTLKRFAVAVLDGFTLACTNIISRSRSISRVFVVFCVSWWRMKEVMTIKKRRFFFFAIMLSHCVCVITRSYSSDSDSDSDSGTCNSPCSYRQPSGRGQSLSRRYCTHSGWSFSCASRTAPELHGALAVSCKYFKQSKWPFPAAFSHAYALY